MTFEGYIELTKKARRSEAEVSGVVKIRRGRLAALCATKITGCCAIFLHTV